MPERLSDRAIRKIKRRSPLFAFEDLFSSRTSHNVASKQVGDAEIVLVPDGAIDDDSFIRELSIQLASDFEIVTLDLSKMVRIDSKVIARFLLANLLLQKQNRVFRICGCSDSVFKMFEMTKLTSLLSIQRESFPYQEERPKTGDALIEGPDPISYPEDTDTPCPRCGSNVTTPVYAADWVRECLACGCIWHTKLNWSPPGRKDSVV